MREIQLTQGQVAIVDDSDYESLSQWKWQAYWNKATRSYYAVRTERIGPHEKRWVLMHRQILGLQYGERSQSDHVDHDTLNNSRSNLRQASKSQNMANRRLNRTTRSGFKGVGLHVYKNRVSYVVRVADEWIGTFKDAITAAVAYNREAVCRYGEYACVNDLSQLFDGT